MKSFFIDNYVVYPGNKNQQFVSTTHVVAADMDDALIIQGAPIHPGWPEVESLTPNGIPEPMVDDLGPCMVYTRIAKTDSQASTFKTLVPYLTIISHVYSV